MEMSFAEAIEYDEHLQRRVHDHHEHKRAAKVFFQQDFKDQTGDELVSGVRVAGRAKRGSATARQEAKESKQSSEGRKAA
jgi:hypothetical protein